MTMIMVITIIMIAIITIAIIIISLSLLYINIFFKKVINIIIFIIKRTIINNVLIETWYCMKISDKLTAIKI